MAKKPRATERRVPARTQEPVVPAGGTVVVIGRVTGEMRDFGTGIVARSIDAEVLEKNLSAFMKTMGRVIGNIHDQLDNYRLDSISLKADVSASGSISLLGTGGTVEAGGGLEFTFKRLEPAGGKI